MRNADRSRTQLVILLLCALVLAVLSFMPGTRPGIASSETRFSEISQHGLNIVPASCASYGAGYFDTHLPATSDLKGWVLPSGAVDYGEWFGNGGYYVCFSNSSSNAYFIPANSITEMNYFRSYPPPGVSVY